MRGSKIRRRRTKPGIAAKIAVLRAREGWSLREAASRIGCATSTVMRWEKGTSDPSADDVARLAAVYKVSIASLYGEKNGATSADGFTREFTLERKEDVSGISGTGTVAVGVVLPTGRCILEWCPTEIGVQSIVIYRNLKEVKAVHGHGGKTRVMFA